MSKTYYLRSTAEANGRGTFAIEHQLATTAGGGSASDSVVLGGGAQDTFCYTAIAGEPGSAAWPTGAGGTPYRAVYNVTAVGPTCTGGLKNGTSSGFFRLNSSDVFQESHQAVETTWTTTGVKTETYSSTWTAGATSDRLDIEILVSRAASHGNETTTIQVDNPSADATNGGIVDGPWGAGGGSAPAPKTRVIGAAVKRAATR